MKRTLIERFIIIIFAVVALVIIVGRGGLWSDGNYWLDSDRLFIQTGKSTTLEWVNSPKKVKSNKVKIKTTGSGKVKVGKTFKVKGLKEGQVSIEVSYRGKKVGKVKLYVVSNAINCKNSNIDVFEKKQLKVKSFIKPKQYLKTGKLKWKKTGSLVKIKQSSDGSKCSVSAVKPGSSTVSVSYDGIQIGKCSIKVPSSKSLDSKENLIIGYSELGTVYSKDVVYNISLSGGGLFGVDTVMEWVGNHSNSIFMYENWSEYTKYDRTLSDKKYSTFCLRAIKKGTELVKIKHNNDTYKFNITVTSDDPVTSEYESWLQGIIEESQSLTDMGKVQYIYKKLKSFDYVSGQTDRYKMISTGRGNCLAGNNVLKDFCSRVGIECETHLIDGDYLKKPLGTALLCLNYYNAPHILCIAKIDGSRYVVDGTPCNRECLVAYDASLAERGEWVNVWKERKET